MFGSGTSSQLQRQLPYVVGFMRPEGKVLVQAVMDRAMPVLMVLMVLMSRIPQQGAGDVAEGLITAFVLILFSVALL